MNIFQRIGAKFVRMENLHTINPEDLTPEMVAGMFRFMPRWFAKFCLELGVRRGNFIRNGAHYKFVGEVN